MQFILLLIAKVNADTNYIVLYCKIYLKENFNLFFIKK